MISKSVTRCKSRSAFLDYGKGLCGRRGRGVSGSASALPCGSKTTGSKWIKPWRGACQPGRRKDPRRDSNENGRPFPQVVTYGPFLKEKGRRRCETCVGITQIPHPAATLKTKKRVAPTVLQPGQLTGCTKPTKLTQTFALRLDHLRDSKTHSYFDFLEKQSIRRNSRGCRVNFPRQWGVIFTRHACTPLFLGLWNPA